MEIKIKRGTIKSCLICKDSAIPFNECSVGDQATEDPKECESADGFTISQGDDISSYFNICICEKCMNAIKYGTRVLDGDKSLLAVTTDTCFHEQQK